VKLCSCCTFSRPHSSLALILSLCVVGAGFDGHYLDGALLHVASGGGDLEHGGGVVAAVPGARRPQDTGAHDVELLPSAAVVLFGFLLHQVGWRLSFRAPLVPVLGRLVGLVCDFLPPLFGACVDGRARLRGRHSRAQGWWHQPSS